MDLTSQTELGAIAAAASGVSVDADTYTYIVINTCRAGSTGTDATTAKITSSASTGIGGVSYRTSEGAAIAVGAGSAQEAEVGNWSCGAKVVEFSPALVVTTDASQKLVGNYILSPSRPLRRIAETGNVTERSRLDLILEPAAKIK